MIKRLATAALILTLAACSAKHEEGTSEIHFSLLSPTKNTGVSDDNEKEISRWAVFLYNSTDPSEMFISTAGGRSGIDFTVRSGILYKAYAVANYPEYGEFALDPEQFPEESALLGTMISLAHYSPSSLPMFGETSVNAVPGEMSKTIYLTRLVSKIAVERIHADLEEERFRSLPFTLKALYLTNVWCRNSLGEDLPANDSADLWYNAMEWHGSGTNQALDNLVSDRAINALIPQGGYYDTVHSFYTMPNTVTLEQDSRSPSWSSRCTRLVIEAEIGSRTYYYPVTIPKMSRGSAYIIEEATVKKLGSLDPEEDIPGAIDVKFRISTPDSWDETYNISENS